MEHTGDESKLETFNAHRSRLFGLAYRMLGTRDDAEDILQEAYIRWHKVDAAEIETPEAWLVTAVTRLSIDRLRKASVQREAYIGPWLPEPLMISSEPSPQDDAELASNLSIAFMVLLERLSPTERAVFLLHDIFDCDYAEIARIIGKTETAARQMVSRARGRVRTDKPRFRADQHERSDLIKKFVAATNAGDESALLSIFSDDMMVMSDGGGVVTAARKIIRGGKKIARLYGIQGRKAEGKIESFIVPINGEPGLLRVIDGKPFVINTFEIEDGRITALYSMMNPEKLRAFENFEGDLSQTFESPVLVDESHQNGSKS